MNIDFAMEAKSDQLNAMDILGNDLVITVRDVKVLKGSKDQPVHISFDGDNNRPWKPSKGMIRIIAACWTKETDNWIGKQAKLYCDPTVKYAGKEVGGIRIRAMSHIDKKGINTLLTINRQQRIDYHVQYLEQMVAAYPADRFEQAFPVMVKKMETGEWNLQQVIAQCQKTGQLSPEQLQRLEQAAPVDDNQGQ